VPSHQVGSSRLVGGRRPSAAVASLSVVVLDPGCKGCGSLAVTGEELAVGPLGVADGLRMTL
jgi:hypothetical protein